MYALQNKCMYIRYYNCVTQYNLMCHEHGVGNDDSTQF